MAGNEQGTMDGETQMQATAVPSRDAPRSCPQAADAGIGERTGAHRAARIATLAEVLARGSDPRLARTRVMGKPA